MITIRDVAIFLTFAFLILHLYCKRKFDYFKSKGVPHKPPTFIFGNLLDILKSGQPIGQFIGRACNETDGPLFGFYIFTKPFVVIKDPQIIKNVLIKDFHVFSNRHVHCDTKIEPILCNSLLAMKTPDWKTLRKHLSPVFTSGKIKMMMPLMVECGKNLENYVSNIVGQSLEMKEVTQKYTTDVIATCAFGIDANSFAAEESDIKKYSKMIFPSTLWQTLRSASYFFAPSFVKLLRYRFINEEAAKYFSKVFIEVVNRRESSKMRRNDLVDILIETKNQDFGESNFKLDDERLVAQAVIFFGAGHETTSATIAFTLHELCINPDVQERLRDEITTQLGKHGGLTYEAVQDMKYLDMIVSETLRKYPLTPFINRECNEGYQVEGTDMVIEKGTPVLISQDSLHWNPKYFPNPEKYDPERFSAENIHNIQSYTYLPFGDGPRLCIGERFGLLSTKLGIIHIVKKFKLERNSETNEPIEFLRTPLRQAKNGIRLTCTKI